MKKIAVVLIVMGIVLCSSSVTQAAQGPDETLAIEALNLSYDNMEWIYVYNSESMAYCGVGNPSGEMGRNLEKELNSIGNIKYLEEGKVKAGNILIRTTEGVRYSYYLESAEILNINGKRYQMTKQQAQHFLNIISIMNRANDGEMATEFPKWLAWMKPSNVVSYTQTRPLQSAKGFAPEYFYFESLDAEVLFISCDYFIYYVDIEKAERYEPGSINLPIDDQYYEMNIQFKSGAIYKIMSHGDTFLIESSDMKYACKYTLKSKNKIISVKEAYGDWTELMANPPVM